MRYYYNLNSSTECKNFSKSNANLKSFKCNSNYLIKFIFVLLVVVATIFTGCEPSAVKFENQQQQNFDDFLAKKREMSHRQANDIQKKEFYNEFEKELFNYIDSVKLFVNWRGTIKDIKTKESGKSTAIEFEINYKPEEYREVTFKCTHLVETANLDNDYIYNQVKNMRNYSTVYFDGLIRTKNQNQVYYNMRSVGEDLNIPYPKYQFWIVDIGTVKRNDNLSNNLQDAVDFCYKMIEPLKLQFINKISKSESDNIFNSLSPEFENLKSQLTEEEKSYIDRINTCLVYNFMYGN